MPPKKLAPVVAVLNMKGGVGKTTISGNLFRELYKMLPDKSRTVLVDFDAQFNLTQLLVTSAAYDNLQTQKKTLWHIFEPSAQTNIFQTSDNHRATIDDYRAFIHPLKRTTEGDELLLVPGDFRISSLNIRENPQTLEMPRKRFKDFIKKAREDCALVVLDCNPSSSFLTRTAIEVATHLLVPIRLDKYSVLGLQMLKQYVDLIPNLGDAPEITVIVNGTRNFMSGVEQEIRAHAQFGPNVMVATIPETRILAARHDFTGFGVDRKVPHSKTTRAKLRKAAEELAKKLKLIP